MKATSWLEILWIVGIIQSKRSLYCFCSNSNIPIKLFFSEEIISLEQSACIMASTTKSAKNMATTMSGIISQRYSTIFPLPLSLREAFFVFMVVFLQESQQSIISDQFKEMFKCQTQGPYAILCGPILRRLILGNRIHEEQAGSLGKNLSTSFSIKTKSKKSSGLINWSMKDIVNNSTISFTQFGRLLTTATEWII